MIDLPIYMTAYRDYAVIGALALTVAFIVIAHFHRVKFQR
jgi:hypothetical protein